MVRRRRLLALGAALIWVFSVLAGGCAPRQEPREAREPITISMALYPGMEQYYQLAGHYMEEHPGVVIEITEYPQKVFGELNRNMLANGEGYDIFPIAPGEYQLYADSDYCVNLLDYLDEELMQRYENWEEIYDDREYEGKLVSLPAQVQGAVVYYNRSLFRSLGLKVPRNWDEFIYLCVQLKARDVTPIQIGIKDDWPLLSMMSCFLATKVQAEDPAWGEERKKGRRRFSTTEGCLESYVMFREMLVNGCFDENAINQSDVQAQMNFLSGKSAMYFGGTWSMGTLETENSGDIGIGAFPLPVNDNGETLTIPLEIAGDLAVYQNSANAGVAVDFLLYTLEAENNALINGLYSPLNDVSISCHSALQEYHEWLSGSPIVASAMTEQGWPDGSPWPEPMSTDLKNCFVGRRELSSEEFWLEQDLAWDDAYANQKKYS